MSPADSSSTSNEVASLNGSKIGEIVMSGHVASNALVAQGIERRFPKPCVAGSNPAGGTRNRALGYEITAYCRISV